MPKYNFILFILCILIVIPAYASAASIREIDIEDFSLTHKSGLEAGYDFFTVHEYNSSHVKVSLWINQSLPVNVKALLMNNKIVTYKDKNKQAKEKSFLHVNFTTEKDSFAWFKIGSSTLLGEQEDWFNISVNNNSKQYYISKTGFWVSNFINNSFALQKWGFFNGSEFLYSDSVVWNWTVTSNTSDYAELWAQAAFEDVHWHVIFSIGEDDEYLKINMSINDSLIQRLMHYDIDISNDDTADFVNFGSGSYNLRENISVNTSAESMLIYDKYNYIQALFESSNVYAYANTTIIESSMQDFIVLWTDPAYTTNKVDAVSITPVLKDTFLFSWCDETQDYLYVRYYDTRLNPLSPAVLVDSGLGDCSNRGSMHEVSMLDNATFVIGWYDETEQDASIRIGYINTTIWATAVIDVDTDVGIASTVSVSSLNSSQFIVAWNDVIADRIYYSRYRRDGTLINGPVEVSNDMDDGLDVRVSTFNSTDWVIGYHHTKDKDLEFSTYHLGVLKADRVDIDDDMGTADENSEVEVFALNATQFIAAWYDGASDQFKWSRWRHSGTQAGSDIVIDSATGALSLAANRINSTYFAVIYNDDSPVSTKLKVYDIFGSLKYSLNFSSSDQDGIYAVSEKERFSLCEDKIIMAANRSDGNILEAYHTNLTVWDGWCFGESAFPSVTLLEPDDNSIIQSLTQANISLSCNVVDDFGISSISLYANFSGSYVLNETISYSSPLNVTAVFNKTLAFGIYEWNCLAVDDTFNENFSFSNYSFTVNNSFIDYYPIATLLSPDNNTNLNVTYYTFNCSFADDINITLGSFWHNISGNFSLNQSYALTQNSTLTFNISFPKNFTFIWNCQAVDNESKSSFGLNYTFIAGEGIPRQYFGVGQCPDTMPKAVMFVLFIAVALFMIGIGFIQRIAFFGIFGSILLVVMSWFVVGCVVLMGYFLVFFSLYLIIYFSMVMKV